MSDTEQAQGWKVWARHLLPYMPFVCLWAAFFAFGLHLRALMPWEALTHLHGLDYWWHGLTFSNYHFIGMASFRHPLLGLITAPLSLFGQRLSELGVWPYWCFILAVFAAVMAGAVFLVYSILKAVHGSGRGEAAAGAALFASFSYTWLLAGCPESFPLACLALLLTLRWGLPPRSSDGMTATIGWYALAILNGGITLSNAAKVILAFLAAHGFTRRRIARIALVCAIAAAVGLCIILLRYLLYWFTHGETKAALSYGLINSISHIHGFDLRTYLSLVASFFTEPIITHGDSLTENILSRPYETLLAPISVAALYVAAAFGAWRARRQPLVKMVLAMFSVDFMLHLIMRWGLNEGHIYCGHWFFAPALLAAMLPMTFTGRFRICTNLLLFLLAMTIFVCGIRSFVTGDTLSLQNPVALTWADQSPL